MPLRSIAAFYLEGSAITNYEDIDVPIVQFFRFHSAVSPGGIPQAGASSGRIRTKTTDSRPWSQNFKQAFQAACTSIEARRRNAIFEEVPLCLPLTLFWSLNRGGSYDLGWANHVKDLDACLSRLKPSNEKSQVERLFLRRVTTLNSIIWTTMICLFVGITAEISPPSLSIWNFDLLRTRGDCVIQRPDLVRVNEVRSESENDATGVKWRISPSESGIVVSEMNFVVHFPLWVEKVSFAEGR